MIYIIDMAQTPEALSQHASWPEQRPIPFAEYIGARDAFMQAQLYLELKQIGVLDQQSDQLLRTVYERGNTEWDRIVAPNIREELIKITLPSPGALPLEPDAPITPHSK